METKTGASARTRACGTKRDHTLSRCARQRGSQRASARSGHVMVASQLPHTKLRARSAGRQVAAAAAAAAVATPSWKPSETREKEIAHFRFSVLFLGLPLPRFFLCPLRLRCVFFFLSSRPPPPPLFSRALLCSVLLFKVKLPTRWCAFDSRKTVIRASTCSADVILPLSPLSFFFTMLVNHDARYFKNGY